MQVNSKESKEFKNSIGFRRMEWHLENSIGFRRI